MVSKQEQSEQQNLQHSLQQQAARLAKYNAWIEPFKLYVEWPEMHKLRAQLQLIADEVDKNNIATPLLKDARKQRKQLDERYQDALLIQSESIAYLERGLAAFKNLDDTKYKRLKRICETLKGFQSEGRIGEAEQDRGDDLVKELRLLAVAKGVPVEISFEPEKGARRGILNWGRKAKTVEKEIVSFEALELAEQSRYLEKLAQRYANVFDYRRDLSRQLRTLRKSLKEENSVAEELPSFQDNLRLAKNELCNQLKAELIEIDQSLENVQQGLEIQALNRALKVTTQILDAALPNKADVKEIRDHHRMLMQQTQAFSAAPKKQAPPSKGKKKKRSGRGMGKLEQQAEALEEFVNTFNSYQRFVDDETRRAFAKQIADLKGAAKEKRFDLEMISEGHRLAAVFEASALMQSHDERSMQREQLQEWIVELRAMPRVDSLRQKFHDTLRSLQGLSERMNHEDISPENFEKSAVRVQELRDDLKTYLEEDYEYLQRQVTSLEDEKLQKQLELAKHDLGKNNFSAVVDIHYQVRLACDRALSNQLSELHRLEAESRELLSDNEGEVDTFHDHLERIRLEIEAGDISQELPQAWVLLEKARSQHDNWIVRFEARLDRLIEKAGKIVFLNTASSFKLISLLSHLDEQRDMFSKVSIRSRRRLEDSLETAKVQLRQLRQELRLAQSLAEEFAKDNPLDDMFGGVLDGVVSNVETDVVNSVETDVDDTLDYEDTLDDNTLDGIEELESSFDTSLDTELETTYQDDLDAEEDIAVVRVIPETEAIGYKDVSADISDDLREELNLEDDLTEDFQNIEENGELRLTEVRSNYPALDRWLDDYLDDGSVRDVLIYSREGEVLAARSWLDPDASLRSFALLNNVAKNIGRTLSLGRYHLASIETTNKVFLGVRLRGGSSMLLLLDNSKSLHPVSNRLRQDIPTLGRIIHEAVLN